MGSIMMFNCLIRIHYLGARKWQKKYGFYYLVDWKWQKKIWWLHCFSAITQLQKASITASSENIPNFQSSAYRRNIIILFYKMYYVLIIEKIHILVKISKPLQKCWTGHIAIYHDLKFNSSYVRNGTCRRKCRQSVCNFIWPIFWRNKCFGFFEICCVSIFPHWFHVLARNPLHVYKWQCIRRHCLFSQWKATSKESYCKLCSKVFFLPL